MNQLSDEALATLLSQEQSKMALSILYDRYFNKLVYFSFKYVQDENAAEDIVQDCFLKLIKAKYNNNNLFSTWIYTIVKNASINYNKGSKNKFTLKLTYPINTQQHHYGLDAHQIQNALKDLLLGLSEKEQLIYTLRYEQELSIKEIATITLLPEGSIKSCLHYMLKKISQHLKHFINE